MKRLLPLLLACAIALTGCGGGENSSTADQSETKVNVFTSQNFKATGFVIQLQDEETVGLASSLVGALEESGECPAETPDYILQFTPGDGAESDYWWLWTAADGTATLVHQSQDEKTAYRATEVTGHQWGEMISKVTEGKGPV